MKFRFFIAAALFLGLAVGCEQEEIGTLSEIQLSQSYVSLNVNGGQEPLSFTTTDSWQVVESSVPSWLTISPMSGPAGDAVITFKADATTATNTAEVKISCGGKTQYVNVIQFAEKKDPVILTCREAIDLVKSGNYGGAEYYIKGVVCKIDEIDTGSYGNATFYLSDDGSFKGSYNSDGSGDGNWFEVYRAFWLNGAKFTTGNEFSIGDEITVLGVLTSYKGTPETLQDNNAGIAAKVVAFNPSLIKVEETPEENIPLEGGAFDIKLTCKGDCISATIPDDAKSWLSLIGIQTSGSTATVTFNAVKNNGGDRSTGLTFATKSAGKTYTAATSITQTGSIIECSIAEYLAAAEDDTQYRISGVITSVAQDSEKYGANLYIKDATGEVYIYGTTDKDGNIQTLASFGAKEGDIIEFVGKRSSYKGTPQMSKGVFQSFKSVTPMKAADVAALADDNKADPQNYIMLTGVVTKNSNYDIAPYGNFDLVDDSGSILVYGVSTGWKGETKKFDTLGVKEGDEITIVAYKTSYKGAAQVVGMYVSHSTPVAIEEGKVVFTTDVLPSAYGDESVVKVGATEFYINQVANFGSGIQLKKEISYIANKTALGKIEKITLVCAEGKTWYPSNLNVFAGSEEKPETAISATGEDCLVYDFSDKDCSYFKIANVSGYAVYLDSITIEYK